MSLSQYQKSVVDLLRQTGLEVYASGQVPDGAAFPFITLSCAYAPFAQSASVTATAWFRGPHAHAQCMEMMDLLCTLIPAKGVLLRFRGGMAALHRAADGFVTLAADETDPQAIGGRMRLNMRLYDP